MKVEYDNCSKKNSPTKPVLDHGQDYGEDRLV